KPFRLFTLNCRSVKNKSISISDFIVSNDIDILAVTETWLGTDVDQIVLKELIPDGYTIYHKPRLDRKGGGVAIIGRQNFKVVKEKHCTENEHFEHIGCYVYSQNYKFRLFVVYRLPSSSVSCFIAEFSQYLSSLVISAEELLITGDFNIHGDNTKDPDTQKFLNALDEFGLKRHVHEPTHKKGHILDLITREATTLLYSETEVKDPCLCDTKGNVSGDHKGISTLLNISKPDKSKKVMSFRKFSEIDTEDLNSDIKNSLEFLESEQKSPEDHVTDYNTTVHKVNDKHAPPIQSGTRRICATQNVKNVKLREFGEALN
ncbi:hypothetical protein FSP39_019678, partial [Pinctada imbricata]